MLSPADMLVVGVAALLFFGPDQLPKVARRAGQVVRDVQSTSASFIREMERAADEPEHRPPYVPPEPYAPDAATVTVDHSTYATPEREPHATPDHEPGLSLDPAAAGAPEHARPATPGHAQSEMTAHAESGSTEMNPPKTTP